jgi:chorismate lyase / 3-hydroxybenzoate synthase
MVDALTFPQALLRHDPECGVTTVPLWVRELLGVPDKACSTVNDVLSVQTEQSSEFMLVSVRVADAVSMESADFTSRTTQAYELIFDSLNQHRGWRLIRVWNFIPRILDPIGQMPQRYFAFNAGRFAAYERTYATKDAFSRMVATASGVGHFGSDLMIHGLASNDPSSPVENPRQVPAYRYSEKYGPLPPCFARATRVETSRGPWLLVGGTASVRGEDSRHDDDLEAQTTETLVNLAALVAVAESGSWEAASSIDERNRLLGRFRNLRVYHRRREDRAFIEKRLRCEFPGTATIEVSIADLCRSPLLIEIEGLAEL